MKKFEIPEYELVILDDSDIVTASVWCTIGTTDDEEDPI
jgi:hypothetical protein